MCVDIIDWDSGRGGYQAVGKAAAEKLSGGRRGCSHWQSDEVEVESSNKLLQTARRKRYREVVEREDRTDRGWGVLEVRNGGRDTGSHCVQVQKYQESEERKGKEGIGGTH